MVSISFSRIGSFFVNEIYRLPKLEKDKIIEVLDMRQK
jgi:hypothetical protein